jgi:hypothetical protein
VTIPGTVRVTLWRPQRPGIPGAETAPQLDVGGLLYGVDVNGAACKPGDFSGLSATLTKLPEGGGLEAALRDSAADAAPAGATMSFTVDAAACAARGGDNGGGMDLLSVLAEDELGDLSRQHIVVRFG